MTTRRVMVLVLGCVLLLPGIGLVFAGGGLALTYGVARDSAGFVTSDHSEVRSTARAVTVQDAGVVVDAGTPDWGLRRLDADLRLQVSSDPAGPGLFVGIAPAADVATYLQGVARDQVVATDGTALTYRRIDGSALPNLPTAQPFWLSSATGAGTLTLDWPATRADAVLVLMNANGSPGVAATATLGAEAGFILPMAYGMLGLGVLLVAAGLVLLVIAIRNRGPRRGDRAVGPARVEPQHVSVAR